MKVSVMKSWFPHPQLKNSNVYVIFDACDMIKLMVNVLGDYKVICHEVNGECQMIKWLYIEVLNINQGDIGL